MIAACTTGVALVLIGLPILGAILISGTDAALTPFAAIVTVVFSPIFVGQSVLVAWMTLIVSRRWRAEPSWVDRFGRAVGVYWIVAGLLMIGPIVLGSMSSGCSGFPAAGSSPPPPGRRRG